VRWPDVFGLLGTIILIGIMLAWAFSMIPAS
jgi:hypothetical protein